MFIYRICHSKWASELKASGNPARWNSKGKYVIYAAQSRSLAYLENLVHRGGLGKNELFNIVVILSIKMSKSTKSIKTSYLKIGKNIQATLFVKKSEISGLMDSPRVY